MGAAGKRYRKCEPSVVHITGLGNYDVIPEKRRATLCLCQRTAVISVRYATDREICSYIDGKDCSWICYVTAVRGRNLVLLKV